VSEEIAVMHLVATLDAGGAERMAVNLVNHLPRQRYRVHLCSTRADGPLAPLVRDDVTWLRLGRTRRWDRAALARLVAHVRRHRVRILHAHSDALFAAVLASLQPPYPRVVWHDHFGGLLPRRRVLPYWLAARRVQAVIAVNGALATWARRRLRVREERVRYVTNFVEPHPEALGTAAPRLPGVAGKRVACVAHLREQKDHVTLVRAFARVVAREPQAHLLLVGAAPDPAQLARVQGEIAAQGLVAHVSWLGARDDVPAILAQCAVGVLGSRSEGLPLALLEYGAAGLATVATHVGQCAEVLDGGRCGTLVPAGDPAALGDALHALLADADARRALGARLGERVRTTYDIARALRAVEDVYDRALA
jgi:glycosyltransferase involved in cell wall biosynthesis